MPCHPCYIWLNYLGNHKHSSAWLFSQHYCLILMLHPGWWHDIAVTRLVKCRTGLVLWWVIACGQVNHLGM